MEPAATNRDDEVVQQFDYLSDSEDQILPEYLNTSFDSDHECSNECNYSYQSSENSFEQNEENSNDDDDASDDDDDSRL